MENGNGKAGLRKILATLGFVGCVFILGAVLLWNEKIKSGQFVDLMDISGKVVMWYLGANVAKAGVDRISDRFK